MATQAEIQQIRDALNNLSAYARGEFMDAWSSIDPRDVAGARDALHRFFPDLVHRYADMAGVLGSDVFTAQMADMRLAATLVNPDEYPTEAIDARVRWAVGEPDPSGVLLLMLDQLVKQPYRDVIQRSADASGVRWARVPTGLETCEFCLILASRGAVYRSETTALYKKNGGKYHGKCDCTPVLVRGPEDYPPDYHPDELYDRYKAAFDIAGNYDMRDLAQAARAAFDTSH